MVQCVCNLYYRETEEMEIVLSDDDDEVDITGSVGQERYNLHC